MDKEAAQGGSTGTAGAGLLLDTEILIPSTIFCDRSLSFLESLVEYLKEQLNLSYHEIALLTNRDERNIWTLYHRSQDKRKKHGPEMRKAPMIQIPLSVVKDRSLSILEVVVEHLRDRTHLTNHQIATVLNRSDKTVSTVYIRTKRKRTGHHNAA